MGQKIKKYKQQIIIGVIALISAAILSNGIIKPQDKPQHSRKVIAKAANFQIIDNCMVVYELRGMLSRRYHADGGKLILTITEYVDADPIEHDFVLNEWSNYVYDELIDIDAEVPNANSEIRKTYTAENGNVYKNCAPIQQEAVF